MRRRVLRRAADENLPRGRVACENVSGKALAAGPLVAVHATRSHEPAASALPLTSVVYSYPPLALFTMNTTDAPGRQPICVQEVAVIAPQGTSFGSGAARPRRRHWLFPLDVYVPGAHAVGYNRRQYQKE